MEISGPGWTGLSGGLVINAGGQPAALVVLSQTLTSGGAASQYALPLAELRQ